MTRSLIWIDSDTTGWACSNCGWRFPVPTLLSGEEAKRAYDRLAKGKFSDHKCEVELSFSSVQSEADRDSSTTFAGRARLLIKRGYKPKVAVDLVLHEMQFEHGDDLKAMEQARADARDFLLRVQKGLI